MLRSYLKIALRQLWRNRLFSLINILGLTVGLAVSTFIALYVWHEFHYDRFELFANRTYRILTTAKFGEDEVFMTGLHESFGRESSGNCPRCKTLFGCRRAEEPSRCNLMRNTSLKKRLWPTLTLHCSPQWGLGC